VNYYLLKVLNKHRQQEDSRITVSMLHEFPGCATSAILKRDKTHMMPTWYHFIFTNDILWDFIMTVRIHESWSHELSEHWIWLYDPNLTSDSVGWRWLKPLTNRSWYPHGWPYPIWDLSLQLTARPIQSLRRLRPRPAHTCAVGLVVNLVNRVGEGVLNEGRIWMDLDGFGGFTMFHWSIFGEWTEWTLEC
jgi:hypothetical protein